MTVRIAAVEARAEAAEARLKASRELVKHYAEQLQNQRELPELFRAFNELGVALERAFPGALERARKP
jgi:DNA helicase HerA-like ATPase